MSPQPPPKSVTPTYLRERIKGAHAKIKDFIGKKGKDRLRSLGPQWLKRFAQLSHQCKDHPEVAISLVGDTGAGKSTLLNALIGVRVLPVSNMRACTAAICEVAYGEGPYRARVEFVSRASWTAEINHLLGDYRDATSGRDDDRGDSPVELERAVRNKLWAVYKPSDDADPARFDPLHRTEPPEITRALDAGATEFENADLDSFRKQVAQYLDSKHRFWPIVKAVSVRGDFAPLADGAKVIDLPGLNDPNEAREAVTRAHLKTCKFVWIVFNIKRALTKQLANLMQSEDFFRQVVMDGRSNALTFVGTAADDVDLESGIEEFGLREDAGLFEVIRARNREVGKVVFAQLDDLSLKLASLAGEDRQTATVLGKKLHASQVLTVSAREYMRLAGLARTHEAGMTDPVHTQIPALREHMREICKSYGIQAHCAAVNKQVDLLFAEISQEVRSQEAALRNQAEMGERQRKELGAAAAAAQGFLDQKLKETQERLVQDLAASHELLAERIKRAVERARHDLDLTLQRWERIHWSTLRAVCRRGGVYVGSTGRNDFPADLSKPILDGIAFAWSDFFGDKLAQVLEKWTQALLYQANEFRGRVKESLSKKADLPENVLRGLGSIFESGEKILREHLEQTKLAMTARIEKDQRSLYESVPGQVKANMQAAFRAAAEEEGAGMKQRVVEILSEEAHKIARVMFDDAREALLGGLRGLNDWLAREFQKMTAAVRQSGQLAAQNLVTGGEQVTAEFLTAQQVRLTQLHDLLASL
jgi:hypothetical protein